MVLTLADVLQGEWMIGVKVIYLPSHTKGDLKHKNVEKGYIESFSGYQEAHVFVRYIDHSGWRKTQLTGKRNLIFDEQD